MIFSEIGKPVQYNIEDAVQLHDELNPKLWTNGKMRPEVRKALESIAQNFTDFLGITDLDVVDLVVIGSNAAYSYTPHSDLDLHLVVDMSALPDNDVYRELFNSKKYQYNDMHDIKIRGVDVELYVQDMNTAPASLGQYSLMQDKWIKEPVRRPFTVNVNDSETKTKYEDLRMRAIRALRGNNLVRITAVLDDIGRARKAGLAGAGEFSPENLAVKMLRTQGIVDKLYAARSKLEDQELSLEAANPTKKQTPAKT